MTLPRVLIVDDEVTLRTNLAAFLDDEGMEAFAAASGEAALALVEDGEHYDVCIMDMRLPGMDGNETIRALRIRDNRMRFLIHTGTAVYVLPADLREAGMDERDVFAKPMPDMAPFVARIRELLASVE